MLLGGSVLTGFELSPQSVCPYAETKKSDRKSTAKVWGRRILVCKCRLMLKFMTPAETYTFAEAFVNSGSNRPMGFRALCKLLHAAVEVSRKSKKTKVCSLALGMHFPRC